MGGVLISRKKSLNLFSFFLSVLTITLGASSTISRSFGNTPTKNNWVRYQNYKIHLDAPEGWRIERDLFGMPIMVLGPERNGERAILSVQQTPIYGMEFNHTLLQKTKDQYYQGRKEWVDNLDQAKYLSNIPYHHLKWSNGNDGFEMGFRYHTRGLDLEEKSIQINCNNRLFLFKTLTSNKLPSSDPATLIKMINQLDCAATTTEDGAYEPSSLQDFDQKFKDAVSGESSWPTHEQLKVANNPTKAVVLEALVEFYKNYENAGSSGLYSLIKDSKEDQYFAKIKDRTDRVFSMFLSNAIAKDGFDCFFGGWPSKFIKHKGVPTCGYPWDTNSSYSKNKSICGEGKLECNPSLFGSNLCVDVGVASERAHATLECEMNLRASGKSYEDVTKDSGFDQTILNETIDSAKDVCSEGVYAAANYGLCSTLKEKLKTAITSGNHVKDESDVKFINFLEDMRPDHFSEYVKTSERNYQEFEARCIDQKGELKKEIEHCLEDHLAILEDFEKIEKRKKDLGKELQEDQDTTATRNDNCSKADCSSPTLDQVTPSSSNASSEDQTNTGATSCTLDQEKRKKERECSWSKSMFTAGSCAWNTLTALVSDLWGTIKAIEELLWDGVKWVGNKLVQGGKWFSKLFKYEDDSSKKLNIASQTSNSTIEAFKKDPVGSAINFFKSIYDGVVDFVASDVACEKWSGIPHASKCLITASSWKCQPCLDRVDTVCSTVGYVVGEIAPSFITGGMTAAIKGSTTAAKITEYVSKMSKLGKITHLEKDILKVVGETKNISKVSTRTAKAETKLLKSELKITGELNKTQKLLGKIYNVSRWPASKFNKVKLAYASANKVLAGFRSKIFGNLDTTIEKLSQLRNKYFVMKAGVWVVNGAVVKPLKAIAKIASAPVRLTTQWSKKYFQVEGRAYKAGLKYGERNFNHVLVSSASMTNYSNISKNIALYASVTKYPVSGSHMLDEFMERLSMKDENNQGMFWKSSKEIEAQAKAEGKNPGEVKSLLKKNRIDQITNSNVEEALSSGKDPKLAEIEYVSKLRGLSVDEIRLESIDARLQNIASGITPLFTQNDYAVLARSKKISLEEAQNQIQSEIQMQLATEKVVGLLDQGQRPSDEALQNLATVKNTSVDKIVIESINRRIMTALGKENPKFSQFDYETWARVNNISVEEAKKYIISEVQDSKNMITEEQNKR